MPLEEKTVLTKHSSNLGRVIYIEMSRDDASDGRRPSRAGFLQPSFIEKVEDYCRKNYARPIGVAKMAKVAKLSRFHFSRLFREARGISPGQYLYGLRLVIAMQLLQSGEFAVNEVAKRCGFNGPSYFCRVFRQTFGITPGKVVAARPLLDADATPPARKPRDRVRRPTKPRLRPN